MKNFLIVFAVLAVTFAISVAFAGPPIAPTSDLKANMAPEIARIDNSIIATATTCPVLARTDYPVLNKNADTIDLVILVGKKTAPAANHVGSHMAADRRYNLFTGIAAKTVPKAFANSNIGSRKAWAVVLSDRSAAFA